MNCMVCVHKFCAYKVPVFSSFSMEELEEVFRLIKHRDIKKGEILLRDGEEVQTLFFQSPKRKWLVMLELQEKP